ncbi:50S ribosomal protein L7/L12-serine acetyltransferase [Klebsiella oxytoca]|uniref:50S ribosomal protein L7/L12-serine acetyltransferase n=1 Tax=Klebsiella oxytoca TaxID=571 RepID=UPI00066D9F1F|nr:50S ribosomal protein L7/L12-serine acetyltransferase [Klebsiella oxytoca]EJA2380375.1 50S ribosomal protein L7/L12-serine acetyltransferase [Klebsiella oxytoca]EJZ8298659.1 50S ribosomal protein L7/L12-serine acetyltransferase [Klebsiella oxytoca]EKM0800714.1 50S ribosomal protein L7/L12-serine acetyltransferase [Klebsiella oxytoca]EKT7900434.1 50S ribosomal protein L7/L12-serine acetyltransferase [Klebsiella oxytoca]ELI3677570.1 50S ribosomal protein L7/L12-serine acetyltransferase [Klebs
MSAENRSAIEHIPVTDSLSLRAVDERHVPELHQLVMKNQRWLQQSLSWPAEVTHEEETRRHVQGNVMLHQRGYAKMFLLFLQEEIVGVLSFNQIEPINKTAYIGYWIDESHQGQGLLSQALQALMDYFARSGTVRRFVIKCRVANHKSNQVALRNGFSLEGCLRQAEYLNGLYDDQNIYGRIIDDSTGQFPGRG